MKTHFNDKTNQRRFFLRLMTFAFVAGFGMAGASAISFAEAKTLIILNGKTPMPGLAKSWKKLSPQKYQFDLDTGAKVGGKPLSQDMVKGSLEQRLSSVGVKVSKQGSSQVVVEFKGAEDAFLTKLAKVKIRPQKTTELALESSLSSGGIRARTAVRGPGAGEVKATFLKDNGNKTFQVIVTDSKHPQVKSGPLTIQADPNYKEKPGSSIFFKPVQKKGAWWMVKDVKNQ